MNLIVPRCSLRRRIAIVAAATALVLGSAIVLLHPVTLATADIAAEPAGDALSQRAAILRALFGSRLGQAAPQLYRTAFVIAQAYTGQAGLIAHIAVNQAGVVNAASFARSAPVAPGSIAAVFGSNLGETASATSVPLSTTLGGSSLTFGTFLAPLFFTSPGQMNIQVPWELAGQEESSVTVQNNGSSSLPESVLVVPMAPGIFTVGQTGYGQGAVLIGNTAEFAAPAGSISGATSRPAQVGETIAIYCTGLGPVTNQPATGAPAPASPAAETTTTPQVYISGVSSQVTFSGLTPGLVGLYQVNAVVPGGALSGSAVPLELTIGGTTSNSVTIAVQ